MTSSKVDTKVVLLGKSCAGKTSLVERYLKNRFLGDSVPYQNVQCGQTIGAAYGAKTVTVRGESIVIGIWDTAGSERYEAMSRIYYRGAKAAILCFDLTDKSSFDRVRFWIGELRQHEEDCKIYLCATKNDLIQENPGQRAVPVGVVKSLAQDCMAAVYETSSKTGENVDELFIKIAEDYIKVKDLMAEREQEALRIAEIGRKAHCPCS